MEPSFQFQGGCNMNKTENPFHISISDVKRAREEIQKILAPSPLLFNRWLSDAWQAQVFLKLENMQPIGSFKIRGAFTKISKLTNDQKKFGVIAASAGNHAQGVAWSSQQLGVNAKIIMPRSAPLVKVQNTRALGAEVILEGDNYDQAFHCAQETSAKTGRIFISAYEDGDVIAGQGTVALEILEQKPDTDFVIGAVGGGGLMAGVGLVYKSLRPQTRIIGCQAIGSNAMVRSIREGRAVQLESAKTFADGIALLRASEKMRLTLTPLIDDWLEVTEESIAFAILTLMEKGKIIAEGSGAVPLAGLEQIAGQVRGKNVVLIISGGNIDVNVLSRVIDIGLIRAGRRIRVNVLISDRPGSLAKLTDFLAKQGANILQAIHDRNEPSIKLDETEVALTLETRGPEHSTELIENLRKNVLRLELVH